MMSTILQVAFGLAWLLMVGALHYYLWRRLIHTTMIGRRWRRWLTGLLVGLAIGVPLTLLASRFLWPELARTAGWPMFIWLGLGFLMTTLFGLIDVARAAHWGVRKMTQTSEAPADGSRRQFFSRVIGGGTALTAATVTGAGIYRALRPELVDVEVGLARLPPRMDGFTIVQVSDIHIGNTIGRDFIEEMVQRVNAINGDAIVITGDLVDGRVDDLRDAAAPLAELRARHGVYFVTGNHEYYSGVDPWLAHIATLGIRALRNEHVRIDDGGVGFDLAGIDDHGAHRYPGHGPDLAKAVAGRDPARELVLLAHQPRQVKMAVEHGVGLQLSGHTHGGQIWPWHYVAAAQQGGLLAGLSRHGDTQLYVSRGTGYWGPPVRVLATAEITRVVLRAG